MHSTSSGNTRSYIQILREARHWVSRCRIGALKLWIVVLVTCCRGYSCLHRKKISELGCLVSCSVPYSANVFPLSALNEWWDLYDLYDLIFKELGEIFRIHFYFLYSRQSILKRPRKEKRHSFADNFMHFCKYEYKRKAKREGSISTRQDQCKTLNIQVMKWIESNNRHSRFLVKLSVQLSQAVAKRLKNVFHYVSVLCRSTNLTAVCTFASSGLFKQPGLLFWQSHLIIHQ